MLNVFGHQCMYCGQKISLYHSDEEEYSVNGSLPLRTQHHFAGSGLTCHLSEILVFECSLCGNIFEAQHNGEDDLLEGEVVCDACWLA